MPSRESFFIAMAVRAPLVPIPIRTGGPDPFLKQEVTMSADEMFNDNGGEMVTKEQSKVATPAALPMSEIQLRIANERPRNEMMVGERLVKELEAHPAFAEDGYYSIPRKDKRKGVLSF